MARGKKKTAADAGPVDEPWELPEGWRWERLGNLVTKASAKHQPDRKSSLPFVGLEHIPSHEMRLSGVGAFAEMRSSGSAFQPGDVLYSRLRPYLNKVWVADRQGACSGELLVLRPHPGIDARYLALQLHGQRYLSYAASVVTGDRPRIDFDMVGAFPVPVPDAMTQGTIVSRIDSMFAEIDEGEAAMAEARAGVETYRKALLKAAVTGELTADWRQQNPPRESGVELLQRILVERRARWQADPKNARKKYSEPAVPDKDELADLPDGWVWASVDQLSTLVTSGSRGWADFYAAEGSIFIRAANLNQDRLDLSDVAYVKLPEGAEGTRTRVARGDFLVTITGANVTKCGVIEEALGDAYVSQHVGLVRPVSADLGAYLYLWSRAYCGGRQYLLDAAYGAGKPGLNLPNIYEMVVALPPRAERVEIADRVRRLHDGLDYNSGDTAAPAGLRQAILAAAFRGELTV